MSFRMWWRYVPIRSWLWWISSCVEQTQNLLTTQHKLSVVRLRDQIQRNSNRICTFPKRWEMSMSGMAWVQPLICNQTENLHLSIFLFPVGFWWCFKKIFTRCVSYVLPCVQPSPSNPQHMGWCWWAVAPLPCSGSPAKTHTMWNFLIHYWSTWCCI